MIACQLLLLQCVCVTSHVKTKRRGHTVKYWGLYWRIGKLVTLPNHMQGSRPPPSYCSLRSISSFISLWYSMCIILIRFHISLFHLSLITNTALSLFISHNVFVSFTSFCPTTTRTSFLHHNTTPSAPFPADVMSLANSPRGCEGEGERGRETHWTNGR